MPKFSVCWNIGQCNYKQWMHLCLQMHSPIVFPSPRVVYCVVSGARASQRPIALVWPMPSVHKHSLAVAREKGHIRGCEAAQQRVFSGWQERPERWATSPKHEEDEFELHCHKFGSARCLWTHICRSCVMFEMWEMVSLPRESSLFLSSRTRWQQCRRTVHDMDL